MPPLVLAALLTAAPHVTGWPGFAAFVVAAVVVWLVLREKGRAGQRASRQPQRGADAALTRPARRGGSSGKTKPENPALPSPVRK